MNVVDTVTVAIKKGMTEISVISFFYSSIFFGYGQLFSFISIKTYVIIKKLQKN